ncbi:hypothetical protein RFI_39872, partial [Reticulomyxa filosa]
MTQTIEYLRKYFDTPRQGSESWKEMRKFRFGGSEMAQIKKVDALIAKRKEGENSGDQIACWWGKWFEDIHEFGAIPCARIPVAYSPDGLIVINDECFLIEIKCPFMKTNLESKNYTPQIQTGLYILPVKRCLLYMIIYRKCSLAELTQLRKYDGSFHKPWLDGTKYKPRYYDKDEIFCGALVWENYDDKSNQHHLSKPSKTIMHKNGKEVQDEILKMSRGNYMCFKCFQLEE